MTYTKVWSFYSDCVKNSNRPFQTGKTLIRVWQSGNMFLEKLKKCIMYQQQKWTDMRRTAFEIYAHNLKVNSNKNCPNRRSTVSVNNI